MRRGVKHHRIGGRVWPRAVIVVLWRAGLRITEALALTESDPRYRLTRSERDPGSQLQNARGPHHDLERLDPRAFVYRQQQQQRRGLCRRC